MARDTIKPGKDFEFKPGIGDFPAEGWGGMELDADPGTMSRSGLGLILNMRRNGPTWQSRSGVREIDQLPNSFATTGPGGIQWLGQHHLQFNPPKLWLASYGCFGVGTEPGAFLEWYNPDKSPSLEPVANFISELDRVPVIGSFDGSMYFGDWAVLHKPTVLEPLRGERVNLGQRQSYSDQIGGFAGLEVTAMQEFDSKLFMALRDPAGAASVVGYWDGVNFILNDLSTATTHGLNFCVWRDAKLVMTQSATTTVRIRDLAGVWTSVDLANATSELSKNTMAEFRDAIYIADGQYISSISNFAAPVVNLVRTLPANGVGTSVATLTDNLYYLWNDKSGPPPTCPVWLGCFEPDLPANNWTDTYKRIDLDTGPSLNYAPGASTLITYKNRLYAGGSLSTLVTHTNSLDPLSTWWVVRTGGLAKQYIAAMRVGG